MGHIKQRILIIGALVLSILLILAITLYQEQLNADITSTLQAAGTFTVAQHATAEFAQMQAKTLRVRELTALSIAERNDHPIASYLLGVEAFRLLDNTDTQSLLTNNLNAKPRLKQYLITPRSSSVSFSPDGKLLASAGSGGITLWDMETRQPISPPLAEHEGNGVVRFSPDGETIASTSGYSLFLWDAKTRHIIREVALNTVYGIAFSPDGKMLASVSYDMINLWDAKTLQPMGEPLQGPSGFKIAFGPDGKTIATTAVDNTIRLWNVETRQSITIGEPSQKQGGTLYSLAFSPDGKLLASGGLDGAITLWDLETHKPIRQFAHGYWGAVRDVAFSPDDKIFVSAGDDAIIRLWDASTFQPIGLPLQGHTGNISSISFSPDSKTLASGSQDGTLILWDVSQHPRGMTYEAISQPLYGHSDSIYGLVFSPNGKTLVSGGIDGKLILWNMEAQPPIAQTLQEHGSQILSLALSRDGKLLAAAHSNNTISLWDMESYQIIKQSLRGRQVAFNPNGKTLVSIDSPDNVVLRSKLALWDVKTLQPIREVPLALYDMAFSPDGKILALRDRDGINLWDAETLQPIGKPLQRTVGHIMAFSPDGKILAASYDDGTITLWNVETQLPIDLLPGTGNGDWIISLAFSPDGKILASGSDNDIILLWDVETHQPIGEPLRARGGLYALAFSPDGKILASGGNDATIILWHISFQSWVKMTCNRVGRNFTLAEWAQYFPDEEYRVTCPQWPPKP